MSLSPFDSFQSRFVTYLLNFPCTQVESGPCPAMSIIPALIFSLNSTAMCPPSCESQHIAQLQTPPRKCYVQYRPKIPLPARVIQTRNPSYSVYIKGYYKRNRHFRCCIENKLLMIQPKYLHGFVVHVFNTLRTGLLNCLNARSRGLTFRHRASCIQGQEFRYSPENAFYIFNQQIYFII